MNPNVCLDTPSTGVIITGGASGIGLASAECLAAVGRPVAIWDIDGGRAQEAATSIASRYNVPTTAIEIDLRRADGIIEGVEQTRNSLPNIGGLVHAAGIVDTASLDGLTLQSWDEGMAIHLRSLAFLVQAILPDLKAQPDSAVVAIASINATLGNHMNPVYTAAKGGMVSLVRSLADRLARDGIRINSLSPGLIMTPMTKPAVDRLPANSFEKRILLERLGQPHEIGRVVRFLLSAEASYITAAQLVVDGGNISSQRI
ncbi:SDR family oxidoreductase [Caenibius sp. WL]|uniref:SDR family NAD(P)-dependent oxidoreductase n=1 Tax=Caenibius sp. WL TaxID=2872646 RepID=UPI001C99BFC4|nr:SDR family oxidoreductase [Caenibius sp. WL]